MNRNWCVAKSLMVLVTLTTASTFGQNPTPWTTSRLKGTPTPPPEFRIRLAFNQKFSDPTSLQEIPGMQELLITQMNGAIFTISKQSTSDDKHRVADLGEVAGGGVNLFSAALHPEFAENGFLFVCLVHPEGGRHTRVSRFATARNSAGRLTIKNESERVILRWPSGGHNGGCLRFGPDGLLYISTGDGSGPNPPDGRTTGQDVSDLLGSILRIDVNPTTGGRNYQIPEDNPFTGNADARPEIFAYGLRNPWKFGIDATSGAVFVADNGWETWEMVHHVRSGQNCGWPVMEGRAQLRSEVKVGPTPIVPPARDHHHSEANSVIGGPVYRHDKLESLNGHFIYGDYITGTIWGLKQKGDEYIYRDIVDTDLRIVDFAQGSRGELYVLDYDYTGGIYELEANPAEDLSASFPRKLSETGLFKSLNLIEPEAGVVEYEVLVPRWHDGAVSRRWVAVPESGVIGNQVRSNITSPYPNGTVFVKNVSIPNEQMPTDPPTHLETQILHNENGVWNPYTYVWNDSATDADLVSPAGMNKTIQRPGAAAGSRHTARTWRFCATNECRLCHNAGSGFILGFKLNQLQKKLAGPKPKTWEAKLRESGLLQTVAGGEDAATLVDPHDETQDLNDRARSYLHANCGMCHHKGGNAIVSFYLRRDMPFDQLKTNKGTGIGTFGMNNARLIVPGDPWRSVVLYRMSKLGYARMPYIGSQVVDSKGVALVADWIQSLSNEQSDKSSAPRRSDSAEHKALQTLTEDYSSDQLAGATKTLVSSTEGSLALLARLHAGELKPEVQSAAVAVAKKSRSDIRGLFDHFVPESERKQTLGRTFDPKIVLSKQGDARRGKLVFFTNDARCRACHDVNDASKSVGPTLTDIAKKHKRPNEVLQHIMDPSKKIEDKFATWLVVTTSGKTVTGLIDAKTPTGITLRRADGMSVTVPSAEIDEKIKSPKSLMPDAVLADMTAQEAADLIAYIQSLTSQP